MTLRSPQPSSLAEPIAENAVRVLKDARGRPLRDLRISVTDRCNFRCGYCMPRSQFGPGFQFLPPQEILSFEELQRVVGIFQQLGVQKLRITGGEPLLRRDLPGLLRMLPRRTDTDLAMTTNGSLLRRHAVALKDAGLQRVTVSLDSLDDAQFRHMSDVEIPVSQVLDGIAAASEAGMQVKVNAVIRRGVNDTGLLSLVRHFRGTAISLRFIEFMDVGNTNRWQHEQVVSAQEMLDRIQAEFPLEAMTSEYRGEVARRYRYLDGAGELGIIASVTQPFCGDCTRARLSAQGRLYTCLFAGEGLDLRDALRCGKSDEEISQWLIATWQGRTDAYSETRGTIQLRRKPTKKIEMSYIGG